MGGGWRGRAAVAACLLAAGVWLATSARGQSPETRQGAPGGLATPANAPGPELPGPARPPVAVFGPILVTDPEPSKEQPAPKAEEKKEEKHDPAPAEHNRRIRLDASWDDGLRFASADDKFHVHVGGNAQIDATWLIGPKGVFALPNGNMNGVENASAIFLRRARLRVEGDVYDQFDFIVEYDFANAENENDGLQPPSFGNLNGAPNPRNIWMQIRDLPVLGNVRFGNQTKPIGMTNNTSQTFLPFLERADVNDAFFGTFDGGFALGVSSRNWSESERLTWQYGAYGPSINVFGITLNKFAYGGRVTALPWYEDEGRQLAHVGLGFWGGELVQNQLRVRARPLLRNAPGFAVPVLVDTGLVPGSRQYTIGPEFALVLGPVTVQAEWTGQFLTDAFDPNNVSQGTVFYHGGYVQVLYFLTGEHQDYVRREGVFGRVVPRDNFHLKKGDLCRGCGAWQVGVRFSYLDLNDKGIQGGQVYDWTLGLNWFLNPNMKLQLNYILEHRDAPQGVAQGWINGFGFRAAYDF